MKWKLSILLILMVGLNVTGCDDSDKDSNSGGGIVRPDAGQRDTSSPSDANDGGSGQQDAGGRDAESDAQAPPSDGGQTTDASDSSEYTPFDTSRPDASGPGVSGECTHIEDLGVLEVGKRDMQIIYPREQNDGLRTSCRSFQSETKPEKVYKFQLATRARVKATGASNYTFELRQGPCGEESSILSCNPSGQLQTRNLPPNMDFYLIVEDEAELEEESFTDDSENFFELEIEDLFDVECSPGTSECVDATNIKVCSMMGTYETLACPTSCSSDSCVGDTCDNPIDLSGGSASLQGDITAFTDKIGMYSCGGTDNAGRARGGQDIVFRASGLQSGQKIVVSVPDAAESMRNIIIQRDSCGQTAACEHFGDVGESSLTYEVQEAGDYYVIIDGQEALMGGNVNYTVSVN